MNPADRRPRVAVVGAGISGLAAAEHLASHCEVVVFEQESRVGGKLSTSSFLGSPLDLGADSFITRNRAALDLCRRLGLGAQLRAPAGGFAALFTRGAIRALPEGLAIGVPTRLSALARSGVLGPGSVARAGLDYLWPRRLASDPIGLARRGGPDPSVADVIGRRMGTGVLYELVDPLVGGINASDVDALSFAGALPSLAETVAGKRSLLRALGTRPPTSASESSEPLFFGLEHGIGSLVDALAKACAKAGVQLKTATAVGALGPEDAPGDRGGWQVSADGDKTHFDAVILALPAWRAAPLLGGFDQVLGLECGAISYSGVATLALAWPREALPESTRRALGQIARTRAGSAGDRSASGDLSGNGLLVSRAGRGLVTAVTFTSTKWPRPESAARGEIVVRASVGRHGDERGLSLGDDELIGAVRADLQRLLGVKDPPLDWLLKRWPAAFPQYTSGHLARQARIEVRLGTWRGLALCGAAYHGIGIPACIDSGRRAGESVLAAIVR